MVVSTRVVSIAAGLAALTVAAVDACTLIAVGKNATVDGSTLMAHTDDAGGGAADLRLVRVPSADHPAGAKRGVYNFFGGYPRLVTNERGPHYQPKDASEKLTEPLGYIPQAAHTYAYFDQDYGMMNEVQLSIGESTCGAKTVGWPSDVPHGKNWFGIAELSKVALERCDSARCAVRTMGELAVQYGFYSEDSGDPLNPGYDNSAEALGIADKYGEVWLFHVLTGRGNASAIWAAQRVQDDHVAAIANGFVIRQMDLNDPDNYLASPNVTALAEEMGWWTPEMGPFDFSAAYGYQDTDPVRPLYVGRRVWRIFDVLAPSLKLDSRLGTLSEYPTYPFSVKPDEPVRVESIMNLLRDYYQGTPYDMSKGVAAGPFGNPMRWDGDSKGVVGGWERPISMFRTMFSFVLQARSHLHDSVGGVMWYAQSTPHGSVYVPFSCSQGEVPKSYLMGKQSEFSQQSSWWAFEFVKNWSMLRYDAISKDISAKVAKLQAEVFQSRAQLEKDALASDASAVDALLEQESNKLASRVVDQWWQFAWQLVSKFSDGYITTGEAPDQMEEPGYPKWWLEITEYAQWPGKSFTPRQELLKQLDSKWKLTAGSTDQDDAVDMRSVHADPSSTGAMAPAFIGLLCGLVIGAGAVFVAGFSRRSGYISLP